ncbi:unnamed protein product [Gadus morhua 'NCC']
MASLAELLAVTLRRPGSGSTSPTGMFPLNALGGGGPPHEVVENTGSLHTLLRNFNVDLEGTPVDPPLGRKDPKGILHNHPSSGQTVIENPALSCQVATREWPHEVFPKWKGLISHKDMRLWSSVVSSW